MIVFHSDSHHQHEIDQSLGPSLRGRGSFDFIVEQPCLITQCSSAMFDLVSKEVGALYGILSHHQRGLMITVSRVEKGFAFLIPWWRFNLSKAERDVALFNGEHFMRVIPQNEDLSSFTKSLIKARLSQEGFLENPTW